MAVRALSPELEEKARAELHEDPARVEADLKHVKDWLAKQPHLKARTDDQWLVAFLRGCKYSLERTKEKIDLYYSIRTTAPELFRVKFSDPKFMKIIDLGAILMLPMGVNSTSPIVSLVRPGRYNPDHYTIYEVMSVANTLQQIAMMELDQLTVCGVATILDLDAVTMGHFTQMTPTTMKKMVAMGQDAAPIRLKSTHYLNTPPGFETFFNFMKSLLNEKNQNRLFVHNKNYEALYQHIPREILPAEYGGNAGTIAENIEFWKKKVLEYSSWLEEDQKYGTDEAKRPGKPRTAADMFGVDGSFRQLQVD